MYLKTHDIGDVDIKTLMMRDPHFPGIAESYVK